MLVITRKKQETIFLGDKVTVTVVRIGGDKVWLGVTAPRECPVHRKEIYDLFRPWTPAASCGPTESALLRSIHDQPGERGTWLIYADWLEEQGDERAEFIRLQVELMDTKPGDPRRQELRACLAELWRVHHETWQSLLPPALRGLVVTESLLKPDSP